MKIPKDPDYDIWKDDDGYYCIRVKRTGEVVTGASEKIVRVFWLDQYYAKKRSKDSTITDKNGIKHRRIYSLDEDRDSNEERRDAHFIHSQNPYEQLETEMMEHDFLKTLTKKQRQIYRLRVQEGRSISECARICGIAQPTVLDRIKQIQEKAKYFFGDT